MSFLLTGVDVTEWDEPSLVLWTVGNLCLFIMTTRSVLGPRQHTTGQSRLSSSEFVLMANNRHQSCCCHGNGLSRSL